MGMKEEIASLQRQLNDRNLCLDREEERTSKLLNENHVLKEEKNSQHTQIRRMNAIANNQSEIIKNLSIALRDLPSRN